MTLNSVLEKSLSTRMVITIENDSNSANRYERYYIDFFMHDFDQIPKESLEREVTYIDATTINDEAWLSISCYLSEKY